MKGLNLAYFVENTLNKPYFICIDSCYNKKVKQETIFDKKTDRYNRTGLYSAIIFINE